MQALTSSAGTSKIDLSTVLYFAMYFVTVHHWDPLIKHLSRVEKTRIQYNGMMSVHRWGQRVCQSILNAMAVLALRAYNGTKIILSLRILLGYGVLTPSPNLDVSLISKNLV